MADIYYSMVGILALIIHLVLVRSLYALSDERQEVRDYRIYLHVIFFYYLSDIAWGFLHALGNRAFLYADTIVYYVTMALSVVLCCRYIISFLRLNSRYASVLHVFGKLFAGGLILTLVVNHFNHVFFWIDYWGKYYAYPLRHVALVLQIMMFAGISIMSLVFALHRHESVRRRNLAIFFFGLTLTVALAVQAFFPLMPFYSIGLMLSTLVVHSFIYNEELYAKLHQINELNKRLQKDQAELQLQKIDLDAALGVVNGLTPDYHSIWIADKETMKIRPVRSPRDTVNKGALDIASQDLDSDELMRMYIQHYVAPEDRERMSRQVNKDEVRRQLSDKDFYAVNFMRLREDGGQDYSQMAFANVDSADGKSQLVFGFRDINYILEQEKALRKEISDAKNAAEAANAAKTSFLFNMSHDIRTPMNAIIGFRNLLEKNIDDQEKRYSYLRKIEESSNVLLSIINNVLEMARIEKGAIELNEAVWSATQFSDSIYSIFTEMMTQKDLEFTHAVNVTHDYLYCDSGKLRDIYINLISNAYKYTHSGGKVHFQLDEVPCDREGYATIRATVSDTGIGMSEDFLPHLFEEFSRESNSTLSKIEGTGLGMPIVKRLVDFMDGTIEVQSRKDEGTTFTLTFTHRIAERDDLMQTTAVTNHATDFTGKRILMAEDNELNAEIAIAVLGEMGFEVDHAVDGQECLSKLVQAEAGYYDLILMDIQMPGMNGYEATKAIRALPDAAKAGIGILAMTANAFEEDRRAAIEAGMNGHLSKPINVREMSKTITGLLSGNYPPR